MPIKGLRRGLLLWAVVSVTACTVTRRPPATSPSFPHQEIIAALKDFQRARGDEETQNFSRYSAARKAIYRCYFTGKLELPDSYAGLRLEEPRDARCSVDERKYDVLFYPVEAVATGAAPVTPALADASLERLLVVVPHEDFHGQSATRKSPPEADEAAATLVGFLTAAAFAKEQYGPASDIFRNLDREAGLFLQKARLINSYYDELAGIYASFRMRKITKQEALLHKDALFARLRRDCGAIVPNPVSFNRCPAVMNNAGLVFDRTYTRYYPTFAEVSQSASLDTRARVLIVQRLLTAWPDDARSHNSQEK